MLDFGQEVKFVVGDKYFIYEVGHTYLNLMSSSEETDNNEAIFNALGINESLKIYMAKECYGYESSRGGQWPEYHGGDYSGLYELVKHLYDRCNKYNLERK